MNPPHAVTLDIAPSFHEYHFGAEIDAKDEILAGLTKQPSTLNPKFLYDRLGSCLFEAITQLPEYYPTRTEASAEIARHVGPVKSLIDLGAADCVKAEKLFATIKPASYVPVDISVEYLRSAVDRLTAAYPELEIIALGEDFTQRLELPDAIPADGRLFFYPGSSIGNLPPADALQLLKNLREQCGSTRGGLLIGIDRVKDATVLERAYDDGLGVTAAFNLNILRHVNHLIRSDFDVRDWEHLARFNRQLSRIEMHLRTRRPVSVRLPDQVRNYAAGETIHTESSYKYTPQDFAHLLTRAGFADILHWTDAREWFSVFSARV
jgi:dimethylhistidine N-methyltransferase